MFAADNDFWLFEFGVAFNVMINNGNFGRLRELELDTLDKEFVGDPFARKFRESAFAIYSLHQVNY